jgi:hypothetical protein
MGTADWKRVNTGSELWRFNETYREQNYACQEFFSIPAIFVISGLRYKFNRRTDTTRDSHSGLVVVVYYVVPSDM